MNNGNNLTAKRFIRNIVFFVLGNAAIMVLGQLLMVIPIAAITGRDVFGVGGGMILVFCQAPTLILLVVSMVKEGVVSKILGNMFGFYGITIFFGICIGGCAISTPISLLFAGAPGSGYLSLAAFSFVFMGFVGTIWSIFLVVQKKWMNLIGIIAGFIGLNVMTAIFAFLLWG